MIFYTTNFAKGMYMHLAIDGFDGDPDLMWDETRLYQFLIDYPAELNMTRITDPQVVTYTDAKGDDSGISGFVIIAESHISVHTFPNRNYVNIDIFSCKDFDTEKALDDAKKLLALTRVKSWSLNRGLEWLNVEDGIANVASQRLSLNDG
tara:strand:- start:10708 stop:11157 length:450 start_codon:yes stop_codon:yes gene_type:complete